jgi:hypothetical protein
VRFSLRELSSRENTSATGRWPNQSKPEAIPIGPATGRCQTLVGEARETRVCVLGDREARRSTVSLSVARRRLCARASRVGLRSGRVRGVRRLPRLYDAAPGVTKRDAAGISKPVGRCDRARRLGVDKRFARRHVDVYRNANRPPERRRRYADRRVDAIPDRHYARHRDDSDNRFVRTDRDRERYGRRGPTADVSKIPYEGFPPGVCYATLPPNAPRIDFIRVAHGCEHSATTVYLKTSDRDIDRSRMSATDKAIAHALHNYGMITTDAR